MLNFSLLLFAKYIFPVGKYHLKVNKKGIKTISIDVPAGIYFFKVINRNTRAICEVCSKLTIKIPEQHQNEVTDAVLMSLLMALKRFYKFFWCSIVDFEQINAGCSCCSVFAVDFEQIY